MRLRILEKNRDKKGTILEIIIKNILEGMGYTVVNNEVGLGGNEIDVVAQNPSEPGLVIICECKAHEKPIDMNDWLKFLGKHSLEKPNYEKVVAIMVALSDANGNVKGNYRGLSCKDEIKLLAGPELLQEIKDTYRMRGQDYVRKFLEGWSDKVILDFDVAFYGNSPYWVVYFTDNQFTVLDKNASFLKEPLLSEIATLIASTTTYSEEQLVNVQKERFLQLKKKTIETVAMWQLMGGPLSYEVVAGGVNEYADYLQVKSDEIELCFTESDFIVCSNGMLQYRDKDDIDIVAYYQHLLSLGIPTKYYNDYYIENIDNELLDRILEIQGGIELNKDEYETVLFILKHSPSALRYALTKQKLLCPRVNVKNADKEALRVSINSTFIQTLAHCLEVDADSDIAMLLFDKLEIRDFNKQVILNVVLKDGSDHKIPVSKRLYYIPFEDDEGGVVVQASSEFIGQYDPKTGYMIGGKKKNQSEKTLFGVVKHKTGEDAEEYISLYH